MAKQEYQERFYCVTVYENPSDQQGYFVARVMLIENGKIKPTSLFFRSKSLSGIISTMPEKHFKWFERDQHDDVVIVGSFF